MQDFKGNCKLVFGQDIEIENNCQKKSESFNGSLWIHLIAHLLAFWFIFGFLEWIQLYWYTLEKLLEMEVFPIQISADVAMLWRKVNSISSLFLLNHIKIRKCINISFQFWKSREITASLESKEFVNCLEKYRVKRNYYERPKNWSNWWIVVHLFSFYFNLKN